MRSRSALVFGTASSLVLIACGARPPAREREPVGVFVSSPRTFETNSFWIEGPDGLVLIDTQFLPSEGLRALEAAERATGKRVVLAVVLHANPDKFNGTRALQDRGVRVITSAQIAALIPAVHTLRHGWFASRYPNEYPDEAPAPEVFGDATTTLPIAGTEITLHVLGAGCSEAHVVVQWRDHVFVGDLVANESHSWLELGRVDEWRERLREIEAMAPRHVHPGRGPSGGVELLREERAYIDSVVEIVRANPDAEIPALAAQIEERYPGYGYPVFLRVGLPAVRRYVSGG